MKTTYANLFKSKPTTVEFEKVPHKPVVIKEEEPNITWKSSEIRNMIMYENLQFVIIGKFSYGKPDITELRKVIPMQCGIKGSCSIGYLDARHILNRLEILEDYVNMLSTSAYYVKAKDMH
ncbi:hypothetical protein FXO37_16019 [Capsicum annuum]|nr:hypothetical protein FXO37_16019 [Capsicum annuum]